MTRVEFYDTHFKKCQSCRGVNLAASDLSNCKLEKTEFFKSNLNFILVENVKVWKSKRKVEVNDLLILEKDLDK